MRPVDSNKVLSERLSALLATSEGARLDLAKRMNVSDGTLGRIKYGQGNPTLDVVDRIATFYRIEPWQLIRPDDSAQESWKRVADEAPTYVRSPFPLSADEVDLIEAFRLCSAPIRDALLVLATTGRHQR